MTEALLLERPSSDIVVLKLHRPQVRNALNLELRTRLADEITRLSTKPKSYRQPTPPNSMMMTAALFMRVLQ